MEPAFSTDLVPSPQKVRLLFRTKTGEPTVEAAKISVLAKALRPPPEKWHGLHDVEVRYRQRYLDLQANQEVRDIFVDCDADTILLKVHQIGGAACHEGYKSCFFRRLDKDKLTVVGERLFDPKQVYKK